MDAQIENLERMQVYNEIEKELEETFTAQKHKVSSVNKQTENQKENKISRRQRNTYSSASSHILMEDDMELLNRTTEKEVSSATSETDNTSVVTPSLSLRLLSTPPRREK